ncbi:hypothetical protein IQ251_13025 [Saccharopolyspora sp. HNM0983]|uniref:Uncharacterized protein n=1 Tax=Saccharopolyspora montiporae TaxID=2781240 RepID=A0A929G0I3_9PSEU|nr:hypothetical protein [Saccharopolyspora sp. HNM0983]MBE9375369.1 hypothetical protein [Saccharopolyspora sp. HNM0983]
MLADIRWRRLRHRQLAQEVRRRTLTGAVAEDSINAEHTATLDLPSADPTLPFATTVTVFAWCGSADAEPSASDIALAGIARRAEPVAARHRLTASERVRAELNTALLHWEPVSDSRVQARAQCTVVDVDPDLVTAVREREQAERRNAVLSWNDQRREQQQQDMCSLIRDPLRATAWWLLDHHDEPEQAVPVAQKFRELRDILVTEERADSPGTLVDDLLATDDGAIRDYLLTRLRGVFGHYRRSDLTDRLDRLEH